MTATHTEQAFETNVEWMLLSRGWRKGDLAEWDIDRALFPARAVAFIRATQPDEWAQMASLHGTDLEERIVATLARELDTKGSVEVLRHGFKFYGRTFRLAYFAPAHGLNPDALAHFERNELTVTRQTPCHPGKGDTLDLVFALNGVPVATCELKNPMTAQTWRDAVRQYQQDRDPNAPIFRFKRRTLVHFAADPDEVHMATRLAGDATRFLPFNRGSNPGAVHCGKGNPANPDGYRTDFFWREVLERERFLDILGSYVFLETGEEKVEDAKGARTEKRETMIFPRYHQLDAVNRLVATARSDGPRRNYLIQHSAGSGKTNSISWLSHRLASLHTAADEKVFDCVVVITDRRVLDRQLQDAVYQIEHAQGVVKVIDEDSQQLAQALVDGTRIVITTIQKFPFIMRGLLRIAKVFYQPLAKRRPDDHARMEAQLQPAVGRFADLHEEDQTAFRDRLSAFVNLYAFLSQIIPYADGDLERVSSFGRMLLPHLRVGSDSSAVHLGDDVELEHYRLQRVSQGELMFAEEPAVYVTSPGEVGTGDPEEDKAPLSEIIARLNDRFATDFTDEDRLFFEQVKERAVRDEDVRRMAQANT